MEKSSMIALLIDAENVSPKYIKTIIDEVSLLATPVYKRIYGDWTSVEMSSWKRVLLENNLTPIQQFKYTQGKNASDSAMIIDAMDILYAGNVKGFCLVSSDSDFTRLAARLREGGMLVIGMGESKTPTAFKAACDTFKYLDILQGIKDKTQKQVQEVKSVKPAKKANVKKEIATNVEEKQIVNPEPVQGAEQDDTQAFVPLEEIVQKIHDIIELESEEDGSMLLSQIGVMLSRMYADFDSRNYGYAKLHKLIDASGEFTTKMKDMANGGKNVVVHNR